MVGTATEASNCVRRFEIPGDYVMRWLYDHTPFANSDTPPQTEVGLL